MSEIGAEQGARGKIWLTARIFRLALLLATVLSWTSPVAAAPAAAVSEPAADRASSVPKQAPSYPPSHSLNDDLVWIAKVRMGNQRFPSGNDGAGYQDRTGQTVTLHSGALEYLSLHPRYTTAGEANVYWLVWLDLNRDGDFDDTVGGARELVAANPYYHTGASVRGMYQAYFQVPAGYTDFTTRMRVSMKVKAADDTPAPAPDEVFEYGEVEDYTVHLVPIPAAPAAPPAHVAVDDSAPTFAHVTWDPVPGAASYHVDYRAVGHDEWLRVDTFFHSPDAIVPAASLLTLEADRRYEARVRAVNAGGASEFGEVVAFRTTAATADPARFPTVGLRPEAAPFRLPDGGEWRLWDPFVLYDADDGRYKVWYTVWGGSEPDYYGNRLMGVGHAWSDDGLHWTRPPGGHVLLPTPDSWDQDGLETVSVVKHDSLFYMWYLGKRYTPYLLQLGLATSTDGVHWIKHPASPVLSPEQDFEGDTVKEPSVLWDAEERVFKMWYNGMKDRVVKVGYATSADGITWHKKIGPVNGDESAGWNHVNVVQAPGGGYQMYFLAGYSVYQAWSADGVDGWTLNPNGPILRARPVVDTWNGVKHDFENLLAYGSPSAVYRDGQLQLFHMRSWFYASEYGDDAMRFGLATGGGGRGAGLFLPCLQVGVSSR